MTTRLSNKRLTPVRANGSLYRGRPHVNGSRAPLDAQFDRPTGRRATVLRSFDCDSTREAVLQSGLGNRADRLSIAYHGPSVDLELLARGRALLTGAFHSELIVDGAPATTMGDWKSVCWSSDDDGDYLELQLWCSESIRIDRQILLSRRGHFALFADAVVMAVPGRIEYRVSLPAVGGVSIRSEEQTRECRVGTARVFPVALPQDRVQSTPGSCSENSGRLELMQVALGHGLYLPVVFDWHPVRRRAPADWRSLTVTEMGRVISPGGAAGHRLRLGKQQLLIYRSLVDTREPRSVLGQHTRYETVIGSFEGGELAPIIMVETD